MKYLFLLLVHQSFDQRNNGGQSVALISTGESIGAGTSAGSGILGRSAAVEAGVVGSAVGEIVSKALDDVSGTGERDVGSGILIQITLKMKKFMIEIKKINQM